MTAESVEARLKRLEVLSNSSNVPGTSITRTMHPDEGFIWCVGVGMMGAPKQFFHGDTIEQALVAAESVFALVTPPAPPLQPVGEVTLYCDGACSGNPGPGGWGVYRINADGTTEDDCGGSPDTTNNRMELCGVINGLYNLPDNSKVNVYVDSQYVKDGITKWIHGWKKNGWKKSNKQPVLNRDLWEMLDKQTKRHTIAWNWVKGHAGDPGNERADKLANDGMATYLRSK